MFRKYIRSGNGQLFRNTSIIAQISDSGKRFDKGFHKFPGNLQRRHNDGAGHAGSLRRDGEIHLTCRAGML